jgi:hypothetical protein
MNKNEAEVLNNSTSTSPLDVTEVNDVPNAPISIFSPIDDRFRLSEPQMAIQPFWKSVRAVVWDLKQNPTIHERIQPLASLSTPNKEAIDMLNALLSRVGHYQATHRRVSVYHIYFHLVTDLNLRLGSIDYPIAELLSRKPRSLTPSVTRLWHRYTYSLHQL